LPEGGGFFATAKPFLSDVHMMASLLAVLLLCWVQLVSVPVIMHHKCSKDTQ